MDKIRLGLVGCGGMGNRHMLGLRHLVQSPFNNVELCALCDIKRENAEMAASEVKKLLDLEVDIFTDLEAMVHSVSDLHAVDIVTDPSTHHDVVCNALDLGLNVMVEKPMAITVRGCRKMMDAAERTGRILSIAENYRRDPSARLVNHLLRNGAIGNPYAAMFHHARPGNTILITPWRHRKVNGGPLLDVGVHYAHMVRYQLGEIEEVYGDARLLEPIRKKPESLRSPHAFYQKRFESMASEVPADAEDMSMAIFRMRSGVAVNWIMGIGGKTSITLQRICGDKGTIEGFGGRGDRVSMNLAGEEMSQEELLESVDGFALSPLEEHLFPTGITADDSDVDGKIIAIEYHELAEAVLNGREVEVGGEEALKDVAALYAILESSLAGRAVKMEEVESCEVYGYQAEIDDVLGITS